MQGHPVDLAEQWGLRAAIYHGSTEQGIDVELRVDEGARVDVLVAELRSGVPEGGPRRSESQVQSQLGDVSILVSDAPL
jgi:hypothetical protein